MSSFEKIDLGLIPYQQAVDTQEHYRQLARHGGRFLLIAEHPPVITLGKHASVEHLKISPAQAQARGIAIHRSDRGGQVIAHLPGQLLLYPIIKINGYSIRRYVRLLEDSVIELLARYAINANTDPDRPGVWVDGAKVAFIGLRIRERLTQHGLALNVNNDLDLFRQIVVCGQHETRVSSMKMILGQSLELSQVKDELCGCFLSRMDLSGYQKI